MAEDKSKKNDKIEIAGRKLRKLTPEEASELQKKANKPATTLDELLMSGSEQSEENQIEQIQKQWYVLRAIGGKERKVKEAIEAEIAHGDLAKYVDQVLIPTEKVVQLRSGKKINKERNFFPGYILIEAALVGETAHILRNITNVIGFLGDEKGGNPIPLRESEANRILGKVDELADSSESIENPYLVGDSIKVIDGPFNNFSGIIEEINVEKKKLKVTVKIFGRKTPVELSFSQVEKE